MRKLRSLQLFILALACIGTLTCAVAQTDANASAFVAIDDVTIVDLQRGELRSGQRVLWRRSRIVAAGPRSEIPLPPGAQVISGTGRFVMPGLWDMHVHLLMPDVGEVDQAAEELVLPLLIAHGVTGVRDMSDLVGVSDYRASTITVKRRWDAEARAGSRVGPRILAAGSFLVDGASSRQEWPNAPAFFDAQSAQDARMLVRYLHDERDVDFIKVYSRISASSYFALLDEARRAGVVVAGHKPLAVSFVEAADAGQKSIEHAREILFESFPGADALRAHAAERDLAPGQLGDILRAHDPRLLQPIFAALVRNGTYYVPTHLTRQFDWRAAQGAASFLADERLRLLHPAILARSRADAARTRAKASRAEDVRIYEQFMLKGLEITGRAHAAGVRIMAGTDAGDSWCFHGSGLHEELALLVRAGLSPLEALRAATTVPAQYMGRGTEFATIAPDYVADLLVLRANPLADIANTRAIEMVVFNGRVFERDALDEMIAAAERKARTLNGAP